MYENLDKAIELLAGKITNATREDQAMKYTQSALNLAHAKATLMAIPRPEEVMGRVPKPEANRV